MSSANCQLRKANLNGRIDITSNKMAGRALYVGRFRIFHKGYLEVVRHILGQGHSQLIIAIGAAQQSYTLDNPFSGEERADMISSALEENKLAHQINVVQIDETQAAYGNWVKLVESLCPHFRLVYSHSEQVQLLFQRAGYQTSSVLQFNPQYSFDLVIKRMVNSEPWQDLLPASVVKVQKKCQLDHRVKELYSRRRRRDEVKLIAEDT